MASATGRKRRSRANQVVRFKALHESQPGAPVVATNAFRVKDAGSPARRGRALKNAARALSSLRLARRALIWGRLMTLQPSDRWQFFRSPGGFV